MIVDRCNPCQSQRLRSKYVPVVDTEQNVEGKTREKAGLIRKLGSNEGLANELAEYQTRYGDWRELFKSVDRIDKVSKADIRRIANQIFTENNRSVAYIQTAAPQKGAQQ